MRMIWQLYNIEYPNLALLVSIVLIVVVEFHRLWIARGGK